MPEKESKPVDFLKHYVKPHKKISKNVRERDLSIVMRDAHIMYNLCYTQHGLYAGALAIAHPQINDKHPLRFFVTHERKIIINPVMVNHTRHPVERMEGCLSFPDRRMTLVKRYHKCEFEYQTIGDNGDLTDTIHADLSGTLAAIYQHELNHLDGVYIFNL
jgi:peptide deformylase